MIPLIEIDPAIRVKNEMYWGKMRKITGVFMMKKVWGLPWYKPLTIIWIENRFGHYVGDERFGFFLYKNGIIDPEISPSLPGCDPHKVCSIGWCASEQKWYGWSHRAICGFKLGDVVKEGDCTNSPGVTAECLKDHPGWDLSLPIGFEAKTLEDCKRMAIAFAESVS
jgi:hypothetical protein